MAEKKTRIILKVIEQVILNGVVVDEQVKESEMVTQGGRIPWTGFVAPVTTTEAAVTTTPAAPSTPCETTMKAEVKVEATHSSLPVSSSSKDTMAAVPVKSESLTATPVSSKGKEVKNKDEKPPTSTGRPRGRPPSANKGEKRTSKEQHKSHSKSESSSKKVKREAIDASSEEDDEAQRSRETANALLDLKSDTGSSPTKKVKKEDKSESKVSSGQNNNFTSLTFLPLNVGTTVLAKWTDKNFYAGRLVTNLREGRWSILFDDGGKKTVHDSDIIAIPHLTVGQVVMATFSDGALCLKGVIKGGRYEAGGKLFYDVEYTMDGSKMVTDRFSKRDIFLTQELATALLATQSKGATQTGLDGKLTKFADVDLNNIIPKRSRTVAQTSTKKDPLQAPSAVDASTEEEESESETVGKNKAKKSRTSSHHGSPSKIKSGQQHLSLSSTASTPPVIRRDSEGTSNHSTTSSLGHEGLTHSHASNVVAQPQQQPITQSSDSEINQTSTDNILGPVLPEGNKLFEGIAFMLTTADASGNTAEDKDGQGRSTAPFDIPHLVRQIESGSGRVFQTLEEALVSYSTIFLFHCLFLIFSFICTNSHNPTPRK
jgi:hypothetical protein